MLKNVITTFRIFFSTTFLFESSTEGKASHILLMNASSNFSMKFNFNKKLKFSPKSLILKMSTEDDDV